MQATGWQSLYETDLFVAKLQFVFEKVRLLPRVSGKRSDRVIKIPKEVTWNYFSKRCLPACKVNWSCVNRESRISGMRVLALALNEFFGCLFVI